MPLPAKLQCPCVSGDGISEGGVQEAGAVEHLAVGRVVVPPDAQVDGHPGCEGEVVLRVQRCGLHAGAGSDEGLLGEAALVYVARTGSWRTRFRWPS